MLVAGAMLASVMALAAQEPVQPKPRPDDNVTVTTDDSGPMRRIRIITNRRARLGVSVNVRAKETDSIGAYINSVTPGGPAAKAGIRSGDVIVKLNGKSLVGGDRDASKDDSAPGLRLIEMAAKLEPNDTIAVELRRGTARKTVSLVTGDEPAFRVEGPGRGFGYGMSDLPGPEGQRAAEDALRHALEQMQGSRMRTRPDPLKMPEPDAQFMWSLHGPLADLELAPINPDLGRYFGVSSGILVISVPEESKLNLKGGDVVLSVGGRVPTSPPHLLRILRSYEPGEDIRIEVMRMKKKEMVVGKVGETDGDR
jgi:S1-C subfamily serine protease